MSNATDMYRAQEARPIGVSKGQGTHPSAARLSELLEI
jgi:hypothetical protein